MIQRISDELNKSHEIISYRQKSYVFCLNKLIQTLFPFKMSYMPQCTWMVYICTFVMSLNGQFSLLGKLHSECPSWILFFHIFWEKKEKKRKEKASAPLLFNKWQQVIVGNRKMSPLAGSSKIAVLMKSHWQTKTIIQRDRGSLSLPLIITFQLLCV